MKRVITGKIYTMCRGENDDALYAGDCENPLALELEDLYGKNVSVNYFISETPKSIEELKENNLLRLSGSLEAEYSDRYSDITGYLWTDENLKVGGHDLMEEIADNIGKYIHLEITVHD